MEPEPSRTKPYWMEAEARVVETSRRTEPESCEDEASAEAFDEARSERTSASAIEPLLTEEDTEALCNLCKHTSQLTKRGLLFKLLNLIYRVRTGNLIRLET
ncbi:hypothetical protein MA16_Dca009263 [Dendrobium catenatum]|uniref:Uncharacterized protein n=1 Tax=Dendrobium catenatum TaxID=906689 RepID=A0A2I0WYW2_9ASPA|nr:hypothetical protein MA16_Dca009263 [Dendrobium catenatum]